MYQSKYNDIPEAKVIPELRFQPGKTPADVMLRIDALKKGNFASSLIDQNKKTTYGAMIGLATGFVIALVSKQNKLLFALTGTIGGALVGYAISTVELYKNKNIANGNNSNSPSKGTKSGN